MTDDDKSLGDDATLGGESPEQEVDAQSLGDQSTHGDHSQMDSVGDSSSQGDQLTFAGDESGGAVDDGMEIVDLKNRYTIERVLGKGGMGEVLLATDTRLERKVAIKRILGKLVGSAKAYQRFLTGAQTIAALNHPNIVQLFDFGRDADGPFMILEYVSGGSLLDRCKQGPIPLAEAIDITCQLCDGLAKAHDAGITHRDIKPANVLMTEDRIPKLTDFDLAKGEVADTGMTMAGAVLGTLDFMPPEQRKDATQVDARSDLWSLAATLYQMVTGESPKVIRLKKVPAELQDFLDKALEEKKDDRYQSARAFKDALLASRSGTAEAELEEGDCPHCGTKNPTTRKFCRNPDCSESLEVPCLSCSSKIPMWEQVCDSCGTPQPDLLEQRRSQMASAQAEAESLLKGLEFDRAQSVAVALRDEPDLRLTHLKGWADGFLSQLETARQQELARFSELMTEAVTHQQAHDYAAGLRTLGQVPEIVCNTPLPGHDQSVHDLRKKLQSDLDEIKRLDSLIRTRVKNRDLDGLFAEVEQLQRLQPGRDNLQKLAQQLNARDSKLDATRDEALAEAKKRLANQDYDGCLAQLNRIDASLLDADIESLRETGEENLHQVNALRDTINLAVQGKQLDGLLPQVEQCLALQAGAEDLLKLRDQLVERDSRNAASIAEVLQQAEQMRNACRFDPAVAVLERISDELATQQSNTLLFECQQLQQDRSRAMRSMKRASETGEFKKALFANKPYRDALSVYGLHDPEFESASAACQQQLAAQQESEQAALRQKAMSIKLGIGTAALVVVIVLVMIVLWVQSSMRSSTIASALEKGDYATVLEMDPENTAALAMQKEAKKQPNIGQDLVKGDYVAALGLDPIGQSLFDTDVDGLREAAEQYYAPTQAGRSLADSPEIPDAFESYLDQIVSDRFRFKLSNETSSRSGKEKDQLLRKYGGNADTENAVQKALEWLAKHQLPDGGWNLDHTLGPGKFRTSPENGDPGSKPEARYGATALALLPFLGNGQTHLDGKYKKVVKRGLEFLMDRGERSGRGLSYLEPGGSMYAHGLVAIVFNEAFAMSKDARLAPYSQGTIWYIEDVQDPVGGGWRYQPKQAGDTSVVSWQVMALKSGEMNGHDIDKRTYKLTKKFLDAVSIDGGAIYGYADKPGSRSTSHKARTAASLLCRMYMGWDRDHAGLSDGVEWIAKMEPDVGQSGYPNLGSEFAAGAPRFNMYYNYYATQVMKHYGGDVWKKWNGKMRDFLVKSQSKEGDAAGSWFFKDGDHGARVGGRLYVTSLACMTLEIYYRYLPLYGNSATDDLFPLD